MLFTSLAFFSYNYTLFFFLTWFPSYLILTHSLDKQIPALKEFPPEDRPNSTIVFFSFRIMVALGGFISDFVFKKTGRMMFSRKVVLVR